MAAALANRGDPRNFACHNCSQTGHFQRNCPQTQRQMWNVRPGWISYRSMPENVTERPLGQQTALIRNTRNGIFIEMQGNQNKKQVLGQLAMLFQRRSAKNRRKLGTRPESGGNENSLNGPCTTKAEDSDHGIDDAVDEDNRNDGRTVDAVKASPSGPKWWIQAVVAGIPVE